MLFRLEIVQEKVTRIERGRSVEAAGSASTTACEASSIEPVLSRELSRNCPKLRA